jgi:hypothetical protein
MLTITFALSFFLVRRDRLVRIKTVSGVLLHHRDKPIWGKGTKLLDVSPIARSPN